MFIMHISILYRNLNMISDSQNIRRILEYLNNIKEKKMSAQKNVKLRRELGLFSAVCLIISIMLGKCNMFISAPIKIRISCSK